MKPKKLSAIASCLGLSLSPDLDREIKNVGIDTRTLTKGSLFLAIPGDKYDGHDFVKKAEEAGASAVVVQHAVETSLPQLIVSDTRRALGQIASWYRDKFDVVAIALTGSSGKTTVKEMIANILRQKGNVLASQGSFNNEIGVPLTLLHLSDDVDFLVTELGANHPGEIAYTTHLVKPNVALINNVAPAHIAGFGSVAGVAEAKSEIFQGLREDGTAVINVDDSFAKPWKELTRGFRQLTFGMIELADVSADIIDHDSDGCPKILIQDGSGEIEVQLPLPGDHNAMNAVAAATCAKACGASLSEIKQGLSTVKGVAGRMQPIIVDTGARIIDDTYNANPGSVKAAIKYLASLPGIRILALGDMGELGDDALFYHRQIGSDAKRLGIDKLYTCGQLSAVTSEAFGAGATHFAEIKQLITELGTQSKQDVTILVKGSRSARMERVVKALVE